MKVAKSNSSSSGGGKGVVNRNNNNNNTCNKKHLSPLARAYLKVVRASKQTQELQTSMSPLLYREMMAGLNAEINADKKGGVGSVFNGSAPYFFANNVKLLYDAETRKLKKKVENPGFAVGELGYIATVGVVGNEIDPVTKLYSPDLLGRKMHPEIIARHEVKSIAGINEIINADIENALNHRFLSLVCKDAKNKKRGDAENVLAHAIDKYFEMLGRFNTQGERGGGDTHVSDRVLQDLIRLKQKCDSDDAGIQAAETSIIGDYHAYLTDSINDIGDALQLISTHDMVAADGSGTIDPRIYTEAMSTIRSISDKVRENAGVLSKKNLQLKQDIESSTIGKSHMDNLLGHLMPSPSETAPSKYRSDVVDNCVKLITGITDVKSPFRHKSTSHDKINTSDYVISICCTNHEYESDICDFGLSINKKIIFASVKDPNNPQIFTTHIPVCEEFMIQFRKPEEKGTKCSPTLVNDTSCLVISYSMNSTKTGKYPTAMHLFGENALSVAFSDGNHHFIQDKTKLCARMAGALCKKLLDIHSSDDARRTKGCVYWGSIFDNDKYTGQDSVSKSLISLLTGTLRLQFEDKSADELARYGEINKQIKLNNADIAKLESLIEDEDPKLYPLEIADHRKEIAKLEKTNKALEAEKSVDAATQAVHTLETKKSNPVTRAVHPPEELVTKSFVMRQDVRSLMKVDRGQHCSIRKWISTQSFSLLSLSPQAGRNYVFIVNHLGDNTLDATSEGTANVFRTRMEDMEGSLNDNDNNANNMHLYSMFDLEKELGLIDLDCSFD